MKLRTLACLVGFLVLAPFVLGQEDSGADWKVFEFGSADQVRAEIAKLPKDSGLGTTGNQGWTPLMFAAAFNSSPEVITVLVKAGAELEARTETGKTPLMNAAMFNSSPKVITVLVKAGAELEARTKAGWTPLMFAAMFNTSPEVITALLEAGADAKVKNQDGKTALDYAKENEKIYKTKAYWELNDATYK
jgi:ankyrin repeat protein